jgi:hypothetical protein
MSIELYLLKGSSLICIRLLEDSSVYFYQKNTRSRKTYGYIFSRTPTRPSKNALGMMLVRPNHD